MLIQKTAPTIVLAALLIAGCAPGSDNPLNPARVLGKNVEETIEFNGIHKKKSELSDDTLRWLEWYQSLPQKQQDALSFVPSEFTSSGASNTVEETEDEIYAYYSALTEEEVYETEELARHYFTELSPDSGGVVTLEPATDDCALYQNKGIEDSYDPGNIIIYYVLTSQDQANGNPMRSISIVRRTKSDDWKVINSGY